MKITVKIMAKRSSKVPKGTRDLEPAAVSLRDKIVDEVLRVYKAYGAVGIDTPAFELKSLLQGRYGGEEKLIYDLADQGGEILSLRYDLTVPLKRYLATRGQKEIKRWQLGKVYRRDQPSPGRYREFMQCDFDIVCDAMTPLTAEAETLKVAETVFLSIGTICKGLLGPYRIRLNQRVLLEAVLLGVGVTSAQIRTVCSSLDKLDKIPWPTVREELVTRKGISASVSDRIWVVCQTVAGTSDSLPEPTLTRIDEALERLWKSVPELTESKEAQTAADELRRLTRLLSALRANLDRITFDLTLARGLDYYTGVIYELQFPSISAQSFGAGGRYRLTEEKAKGSVSAIKGVGFSVGIDRVLDVAYKTLTTANYHLEMSSTQIMMVSLGTTILEDCLSIATDLRDAGFSVDCPLQEGISASRATDRASKAGIPVVIYIGEDEIATGTVTVRDMTRRSQEAVPRASLLVYLKNLLKLE